MSDENRLSKFWNELKRRKVIRVIIVYATTAFILLQLVDLIKEPLHLPQWIMTFFVVLLLVGFPIAVIFSWIFDVTPSGIEVTKSSEEKTTKVSYGIFSKKYLVFDLIIGVLLVTIIILAYPKVFKNKDAYDLGKTIAFLPPTLDSPDSSNIHIINGLWQALITNTSMVNGFEKVMSRGSVKKYKNTDKGIQEIAKELDVDIIVESNGQIVGDKIQFTCGLINGVTGSQFWSKPYTKSKSEMEILQQDIAKEIANEINVEITPDEKERIENFLTSNELARDFYYRGLQVSMDRDSVEKAIKYFEKAIENDNEFAHAYAYLVNLYYYLDNKNTDGLVWNPEIEYRKEIGMYAAKAMLYNSQLDLSLIALATHFRNERDIETAIDCLVKALEYNPNSFYAKYFLLNLYDITEDDEFFLRYAQEIINEGHNLESTDTELGIDNVYFLLSQKFKSWGFHTEALDYNNKALDIRPNYIMYYRRKSEIILNKGGKDCYEKSFEALESALKLDSVSEIVYARLAQNYYLLRDYQKAYELYNKFFELYGSNVADYQHLRSGRLAIVYREMEEREKADMQINNYRILGERTTSEHNKFFYLTGYYSFYNDTAKALENLRLALQYDITITRLRHLRTEPLYDSIRKLPEFDKIVSEAEKKFWARHERIKANLTEKGLLPIKL